jgi:hypothetical protein
MIISRRFARFSKASRTSTMGAPSTSHKPLEIGCKLLCKWRDEQYCELLEHLCDTPGRRRPAHANG